MEVIVERNCRLKRALILSLKKTELSEEMQAKQTPFLQYLQVSGPGFELGGIQPSRTLLIVSHIVSPHRVQHGAGAHQAWRSATQHPMLGASSRNGLQQHAQSRCTYWGAVCLSSDTHMG